MSRNPCLLSVLLIAASLSISAALRCSVCDSQPEVLMEIEGIALSAYESDTETADISQEYIDALKLNATEPICEESECGDGEDICVYTHAEFAALGMPIPEEMEALGDIEYSLKLKMRTKHCGVAGIDNCALLEEGMINSMMMNLTEEEKKDVEFKMGVCESKSCGEDGCTTDMTRDDFDLDIADPISCYSCSTSDIDILGEDNDEDCTQTEQCAEGVVQCLHAELTVLLPDGSDGSMMYKGCARVDVVFMALADGIPGTNLTISSKSLKVCEGNLCENYEEISAAGITKPRLVLLLVSFLFTFLQLNA